MNKCLYNYQKGYIGVLTVMIISVITLAIATTVALLGINEMIQTGDAGSSQQVFEVADGCAEEANLRLKEDPAYTGGVINYPSATCTVAISGTGSNRNITSTATVGDFTRTITTDVTFVSNIAGNTEGIDLTGWSE